MTFQDDFKDAHKRHWCDAERLFGRQRWANADHLYGVSAECGLKAVLEAENQPVEGRYRKHVDRLWPRFIAFVTGRTGAGYLSMLPGGEPFQHWSVDQRYAHQRHFGEAQVGPHRDAAYAVRSMVLRAIQDGLL